MNFAYTEAERKAQNILQECGLDDPTQLPLKTIILGRKAFYSEAPLKNKQGEIVSVANRSIITVNSEIEFETKKRFAGAHELGHYEMHRDLKPIFSDTEEDLLDWYRGGQQEMEANLFAAEFLMPSELFHKECKQNRLQPYQAIDFLSGRFHVSKTATILKYVAKGNYPVMVVYCKNNKMKWWKKSDDFYPFLLFEYDQPPPTGSVAYEVFTANKTYFGDEAKQQIWKSDWFKMEKDENDKPFFEYCLHARSYGYTISVIWQK